LRQELVEAFIDAKYVQFVKNAAFSFQEQKKLTENSTDPAVVAKNTEKEIEDAKKLVKNLTAPATMTEQDRDEKNSEIIRDACKSISSLKPNEFDIRLNTNLYQPIVELTDDQSILDLDRKLLGEASDFIVHVQIPALVRDSFRFKL
jgi:protein TIF31